MNNLIFQPVIVMCLLSFIMMVWMYATRLPAAKKLQEDGIDVQKFSHPSTIGGIFPSEVERVADNYNHLFEQPVAFYALVVAIAMINSFDLFLVQLAWIFVVLRVVHSMVPITFNFVPLRFFLFCLGWFVLAYMAYYQFNLLS